MGGDAVVVGDRLDEPSEVKMEEVVPHVPMHHPQETLDRVQKRRIWRQEVQPQVAL